MLLTYCFVGEKSKHLKKSILKLKDSKLILFYFPQTSKFQEAKLYNRIGYFEGAQWKNDFKKYPDFKKLYVFKLARADEIPSGVLIEWICLIKPLNH